MSEVPMYYSIVRTISSRSPPDHKRGRLFRSAILVITTVVGPGFKDESIGLRVQSSGFGAEGLIEAALDN